VLGCVASPCPCVALCKSLIQFDTGGVKVNPVEGMMGDAGGEEWEER